jgi:hypothetical protein
VAGRHGRVRPELPAYEAAFDREARLWRMRHILIPMLAFLPSVRSFAVCGTREHASALASGAGNIYPDDYRVFLPRQPGQSDIHDRARCGTPIWPLLQATDHGRRLASEFLQRHAKGRRAIVISLRDSDYAPERNSRIAEWIAFADGLDQNAFAPIFVYDTDTAVLRSPPDLSNHLVCEAATWNIEFRMGLYQIAWLNMAVMHGPMELCWYNERARYLLFIPVGSDHATSQATLVESGHRPGKDLAFAKPFQRIVWEAETLPVMQSEFARMLPILETSHLE